MILFNSILYSQERNVIEAATVGASQAIPAVLSIIANIIAFVALLAFTNGVLGYAGGLVGFPQLSVEVKVFLSNRCMIYVA